MAVVVVGRVPGRPFQRVAGAVGGQKVGGRHDRVEVVVYRGVLGRAVVVGRRAPAVAVGVAHQIPRADRPVGDVELHRPRAAVREVEPVVDPGGGREGALLHVDRGQQQPVDARRSTGRWRRSGRSLPSSWREMCTRVSAAKRRVSWACSPAEGCWTIASWPPARAAAAGGRAGCAGPGCAAAEGAGVATRSTIGGGAACGRPRARRSAPSTSASTPTSTSPPASSHAPRSEGGAGGTGVLRLRGAHRR